MIGVLVMLQLCTASVDVPAPQTVAADSAETGKVFSHADPPAAPNKPAPWIKSPIIYLVQVIAGLGMRGLLSPIMPIPVLGPLIVMLLGPPLEALGVTWAGDRLGDSRGGLLLPWLVSGLLGGTGSLISAFTNAALIAVLAGIVVVTVPGVLAAFGVPPLVPAVVAAGTGALVAVLAGVVLVQGFGWMLMLLSPVASTAVYRATSSRKEPDDLGTGFVGLLPRFGG